ncbi:unnamed protein product, partial [Rotaria sp. Silwood2]
ETQSQYFNPITTWKQISLWSKILGIKSDKTIDSYNFWHLEQQNIIDDNQTISSTLGQAESINVDILNGDDVVDIILSYDNTIQMIHILKSCSVQNLLNNPKYLNQLNLKISPRDCCLVRILDESKKQTLNSLDMENPISNYVSDSKKLIHFQICILIHIIQYDHQNELSISISHRNITVKQLLEMSKIKDVHTYLASYKTEMILSENTNLFMINDMKFILVKQHQTCLISINPLDPGDAHMRPGILRTEYL